VLHKSEVEIGEEGGRYERRAEEERKRVEESYLLNPSLKTIQKFAENIFPT